MRIVLLFNPVSGSGRSRTVAQELHAKLVEAGHDVQSLPTQRGEPREWLDAALGGAGAMVIVGGDGAVRLAAGAASRTGVPIFHYPCGTENLFAREFGMVRSPSQLISSINRGSVRMVDLGEVNGHPFTLMASVGLDAEVVRDLTARRGPAISHLSYAWPTTKQLLLWKPPSLAITVDGRPIVELRTGQVIVANSRQYGWRLNPAADADMADGLLDVVFFPARTKLDLVMWAWRCARHRQLAHPRVVHALGRHVVVACPMPAAYQIDGDPPPNTAVAPDESNGAQVGLRLEITVRPACLPVLLPAHDDRALGPSDGPHQVRGQSLR